MVIPRRGEVNENDLKRRNEAGMERHGVRNLSPETGCLDRVFLASLSSSKQMLR
jgi:hypothetical protein